MNNNNNASNNNAASAAATAHTPIAQAQTPATHQLYPHQDETMGRMVSRQMTAVLHAAVSASTPVPANRSIVAAEPPANPSIKHVRSIGFH